MSIRSRKLVAIPVKFREIPLGAAFRYNKKVWIKVDETVGSDVWSLLEQLFELDVLVMGLLIEIEISASLSERDSFWN